VLGRVFLFAQGLAVLIPAGGQYISVRD